MKLPVWAEERQETERAKEEGTEVQMRRGE